MLPVPMKGSYINLPGAAYIHRVEIGRKKRDIHINTRAWFAIRRDISASIEVFP